MESLKPTLPTWNSTVMDLVSYQKQGVVRVDLASSGKYSYGPPFVLKAGGGRSGPHFARKVLPLEAKSTPTTPCFRYETRSITVFFHYSTICDFPRKARSTPTVPCFRYETKSITVLFTRSEVYPIPLPKYWQN